MLLHSNARLFSHPAHSSNPMVCRRWQPTRAASGNGKPFQQQQQDDADDPVAAMLWAAQQQDGLRVVFQEEGGEEVDDLEDVLEDLEDPWMRNPSPPEWSEAPLFGVTPDMPSSNSSSSSDGAAAAGTAPTSDPGSLFATVSWQQLQQRMREEQQQRLVVLEVKCPDDPQQQQQQPCRPLPDPLPWPQSAGENVQRVTVESLAGLTREQAAEWQQEGAVVAVWDSGHHSCLAAAIRLSAVYRLPHVELLQQDSH